MSQYIKEHRAYFESDAGKELLHAVQMEIKASHQKAETATDRDLSFAFTQRAKGLREVTSIIKSMVAEGKKSM